MELQIFQTADMPTEILNKEFSSFTVKRNTDAL